MLTPIRINRYPIALPYVTPYRTSYGEETHKVAVIIEVITQEGLTGWGEVSVEAIPLYAPETVETALHVLDKFFIPRLLNVPIKHPSQVAEILRPFKGHTSAKSGLEAAFWDAFAQTHQLSLAHYIAQEFQRPNPKSQVDVAAVVGLESSIETLLQVVNQRVQEGYRTVKLKIAPGWDIDPVQAVAQEFPELNLIVDGNGSYTPQAEETLLDIDEIESIMLIEQPFASLQEHSLVPFVHRVCLDESIGSLHDVYLVEALDAGEVLNLKPFRLGGLWHTWQAAQVAWSVELEVRLGGMLETGIGRAFMLAIAAQQDFQFPADLSATRRYFARDITPNFDLTPHGTLTVPIGVGLGVAVDREFLQSLLLVD